jgi:ceroid-lipofuscinosis MFS transporter 7
MNNNNDEFLKINNYSGDNNLIQENKQSSSKKVIINISNDPNNNDEKKPLLSSETEKNKNSYTSGIAIMLFITFLSSVCFSIVLPSIWKFLNIKFHASKFILGWAVASNSAGSFLASPLFGWWADKRTTREVIASSLLIMIFGNLLYSLSENIWMLLAGRFIVGIASANYAVAQTYLSYATTPESRTKIMGLNSAANVLGFIIGPAFSLLLAPININFSGVKIVDYNSPGYLSAIMSLGSLISVIFLKEISPHDRKKKIIPINSNAKYGSGFYSGQGSVKDVSQIIKLAKNANKSLIIPICICLYIYFSYTTSFTVFETIATPYTEYQFKWDVLKNSILFIILGCICVISLMLLQIFVRYFNDQILLIGCTSFSVASFISVVDFKGQYVNLTRFSLGCAFGAISYSTSVAVLISIFSKILENSDQGVMMGWLSSSGSIARIIGPLIASYTLDVGGPRLVFSIMLGFMFLTLLITIISYPIFSKATKNIHLLDKKSINTPLLNDTDSS